MKTLRLFGALLCLLPTLQAASAETVQPAPAPSYTVNVPTTAAELALGYASAIQQMSLKSLVVYVKSDGKTVPLKGLRTARAVGAVLLITFSAGDMMAINAENIIMITDGSRTP
ncbi:MAG TPA: hypothetical protein VG734_25360 [Lacunisphaera sp.]|nr:hypothetical protein [Lacunisphaera sp.]